MSLDDFPPSEHESMAYIRIVDYPYTRTLKQMYSENTGNVKIELNGNETCAHCLLVISPVYSQMPENCKTMVKPISLQVNGNANPNFAFHEREECRLFNAEKIIPDDNGRFLLLCTFFVALISSSFLYFYSFFKAPKQSQKGQIRL